MAITLANGATVIELPDTLSWADEFSWSPVVQSATYTTTGAMLLEHGLKQAGRPITLEGVENKDWCTRSTVQTLRTWAATPGIALTLVLRGETHSVTFNHEAGALEGLPVMFYDDGSWQPDDFFVPTVRLLTL